tara:strand:- start:481 stop:855 length:375 start_codon:yes stop_codon:yes gene_type:complete
MDVMLGPVGRSQTSIRPWSQRRPENLYDALVRAAPFQEIEESIAEQDELREILADAVDELTEEEQWIFLMLTTVRLSLRFVGRVLDVPKTTLARRRDRIIQKLQAALLESPLVQERVNAYSSES